MPDDIQKKIFSRNLLDLLDSREKSQKEVADAIGVSPQTFNTWCQGVAIPRMGKVQLLADYFHIKKSDLIESKSAVSASDPLQSYLSKLSEFLTGSPEHRQLVSDAAHVRTEDIELACQFLERLADPDSAAPDLPVLDTCNRQKDTHSDTLDTSADTLDTSRDSDHRCVELTADTLALVRDTPEVLEAEAEYIKKMSIKPPKRGGTVSPSTEGTSRKSG